MRVLLVDDHAVVRTGLRGLLATADIHEAASGEAALALLGPPTPDLVILDLNLPGLGGFELLRRLLEREAALRVLVLSMHAEPRYAARALEAGARGYMSKNATPDELRHAVTRVAAGGRYVEAEIAQELAVRGAEPPLGRLTPRELELLRLLGGGRSLTEIGVALGVSYKTVANGCTALKAKLGVARTADLIRLAMEGVG